MSMLKRLRKLRRMSAAEITTRLRDGWQRRRERKVYAAGTSRRDDGAVREISEQLGPRAARLVPGTQSADVEKLASSFPQLYERIRTRVTERAACLLDGESVLLGKRVDLRGPIDWHRDPLSDYSWPRKFYADVPLYDLPEGVDVKYVWEVNRHQFLVDLAFAWKLTGDEKYAARTGELLLHWIDENRLYAGVNWSSGLEVAIRAISWLWITAALSDSPSWTADAGSRIAQSLALHATYLEHHLSLYSSPYNHLMGEAVGLFLIGLWLEGSEDAARWEQIGRNVLIEHGPQQFYADGFCVEQATGYHFFTLSLLVHAAAASRTSGRPLKELDRTIAAAFSAGAALRQPDGDWPPIGDVDSARALPVVHDNFWDFDSLCSLGAVFCELPELKALAQSPGEELYWLLGFAGLEAWDQLPSSPPPTCAVLPHSGYAVARSGREETSDWLLFDAGPLAHGLHSDGTPSVAHGHADMLQVHYCQEGKPLLVDAGMAFYGGRRDWVDHFRSAAAHNTFEVDGAAVAHVAGRLAWSHVCSSVHLDAKLCEEAWLARGTMSPAAGVSVVRHLLGLPGKGVWIADFIVTNRPRYVRWYWQMPRDRSPAIQEQDTDSCVVSYSGGSMMAWADNAELAVRLDAADEDSAVAWQAPGYGLLSEGVRVSLSAQVLDDLLVVSYFGPKAVSANVAVGGRRFVCLVEHSPLPRDPAFPAGADVAWSLAMPEGALAFAAGVPVESAGDGWSELSGEGAWPAVVKRS